MSCIARVFSLLFACTFFLESAAKEVFERSGSGHVRGVNNRGRSLLGDSGFGEERVEEFETLAIVLGILSLVCCVGCFGYYWYNKKEQYNSWINEDVPRYIVL